MRKLLELTNKESVKLKPMAPFNFDATAHKPSWFPSSDLYWEKGKYWQSLLFKGKILGIKMESKGVINQPKIELTICSDHKLSEPFVNETVKEISFRFKASL